MSTTSAHNSELTDLIGGLLPLTLDKPAKPAFSFFEALKVTTDENRHSAFIASLLDPKGDHGQGTMFLERFIEIFGIDVEDSLKDVTISTEYIVENGRIDIVIWTKPAIFIENKIQAIDQKEQLSRYSEADESAKLLYLTLDGKDASEESKQELVEGEQYWRVSYKKHVIRWLETSLTQIDTSSPNGSFVKQSVQSYLNLVNQLTNTFGKMELENFNSLLVSLKDKNLTITQVAEFIAELQEFQSTYSIQLRNELRRQLNDIGATVDTDTDLGAKFKRLRIYPEGWNSLFITVGFDGFRHKRYDPNDPLHDCWIAFEARNQQGKDQFINSEAARKLTEGWAGQEGSWLAYTYLNKNKQNSIRSTLEVEQFAIVISAKVKEIVGALGNQGW